MTTHTLYDVDHMDFWIGTHDDGTASVEIVYTSFDKEHYPGAYRLDVEDGDCMDLKNDIWS